MALLALAECERVHRVSEVRAGPVADMLERLGAFSNMARFEQLMLLCACDYRAYPGYEGRDYPKAALLDIALKACARIDETRFAGDALQQARAEAIAAAFGSERWSQSKP
jgi:tRNA nucleotidyltransferase (CCA-adding enzyme)